VNWGSGSARMRRFSPLLDVSCAIFANICSAAGRSAMGRVEANASPARLNASWRCRRKGGDSVGDWGIYFGFVSSLLVYI